MIECAWVYILASRRDGALYIGVTRDIGQRLYANRHGMVEGFTRRYGISKLVHIERYDRLVEAIQREKQLKKWYRRWKVELIEQDNPLLEDLYDRVNM